MSKQLQNGFDTLYRENGQDIAGFMAALGEEAAEFFYYKGSSFSQGNSQRLAAEFAQYFAARLLELDEPQ